MDSQASRPQRLDTMDGKDLGDEYLFYDARGDAVHVLNGAAREVYLHCDGERTVEDLVRIILDRYEVEEPAARKDVLDVLEQLVRLKLISLS